MLKAIPEIEANHVVPRPFRGYRDEEGVAPGSNTETLSALRLEVDSWRWIGCLLHPRRHQPEMTKR